MFQYSFRFFPTEEKVDSFDSIGGHNISNPLANVLQAQFFLSSVPLQITSLFKATTQRRVLNAVFKPASISCHKRRANDAGLPLNKSRVKNISGEATLSLRDLTRLRLSLTSCNNQNRYFLQADLYLQPMVVILWRRDKQPLLKQT